MGYTPLWDFFVISSPSLSDLLLFFKFLPFLLEPFLFTVGKMSDKRLVEVEPGGS